MQLTLSETKSIIKYIIDNNKKLQDKGDSPIAINICGEAGIGKSAILEQIAVENNSNFIKLNLAQITEPGDLIGFPIKEHYMCKEYIDHPEDNECVWVSSESIDEFIKKGWTLTEETRMGYAIPSWLKQLDLNKSTVLLLDDYSRATPAILQACMEIIYKQEYISWKLPKYSTIVLSTNPDNGDYSVSSFDEAQTTRFITFNVKFDIDGWAKWAEEHQIDGRSINFMLQYHHELMDKSVTHQSKINARNYTMFSNIISGIDDWSNSKSLSLILQIASGCFLDDDDIVGALFTSFIANKLDKLISPEDLITKDWSYVKGRLESQIYDGDNYRADIASIVTTRFINYTSYLFDKKNSKTDIVVNRILDIVNNDKLLLSEDLLFNMIKTLNKKYPTRCNKLLLNSKIAKNLI